MSTKTCIVCNTELSLTEFTKDSRNKDGHTSLCYKCSRERKRCYRIENPEKVRTSEYAWRKANRDKVLLYKSRSYQRNKEMADASIARCKKAKPDLYKEMKRTWAENNQESIEASRKKFKDANRESINEANKIYKQEHPDRYRDYCENRRARIKDQFIEDVKRIDVFERDEGICHICGAIVDDNDWHLDHIMPLSNGGEHSYDNVAVSHPKCNLQKGAGWMQK